MKGKIRASRACWLVLEKSTPSCCPEERIKTCSRKRWKGRKRVVRNKSNVRLSLVFSSNHLTAAAFSTSTRETKHLEILHALQHHDPEGSLHIPRRCLRAPFFGEPWTSERRREGEGGSFFIIVILLRVINPPLVSPFSSFSPSASSPPSHLPRFALHGILPLPPWNLMLIPREAGQNPPTRPRSGASIDLATRRVVTTDTHAGMTICALACIPGALCARGVCGLRSCRATFHACFFARQRMPRHTFSSPVKPGRTSRVPSSHWFYS